MANAFACHICPHEFCDKVFNRPSKLMCHLRTHSNERPYKCTSSGCDRTYTSDAHLKRHIQSSHTTKETTTIIICSHEGCGQKFKATQNLNKHIQRVHDRSRFSCPEEDCSMGFLKRTQLRKHMATHTLNQFKCDAEGCERTFDTDRDLERHKKVHKGYPCTKEGCGENFPLWTLLRKHIAKEHIKSIACRKCGKTFQTRRWLKQHQFTHEGTRDMFVCPEANCERMYFDMRNLNSHIRVYHGGSRWKCEHTNCGRTFSSKQKLQQHSKVHDLNCPIPKRKSRKGKPRISLASRLSGLPDKVGRNVTVVPVAGSNLVAFIGPGEAGSGRSVPPVTGTDEAGPAVTGPRRPLPAQSHLSGTDSEWEPSDAELVMDIDPTHCTLPETMPRQTPKQTLSIATCGAVPAETTQTRSDAETLDSTGHDVSGIVMVHELGISLEVNSPGEAVVEEDGEGLVVTTTSVQSESTYVANMNVSSPQSPYLHM